jgi:hypothetical protein
MGYDVKDSGKRVTFAGGMVRDVTDDKINWSLVADGPMLRRWAVHMTKGAKKYEARNWMKAQGEAEHLRARESAFRHFMQWYHGATDEDHAAAVFFNINLAEYTKPDPPAYADVLAHVPPAEPYVPTTLTYTQDWELVHELKRV